MSLYPKIDDFIEKLKENVYYHARFSNPVTIFKSMYDSILDMERGTELPYYFPHTGRYVKNFISNIISESTIFAAAHESDLNKHKHKNHKSYDRLNYFVNNFHLYSNETIHNLYYYTKLPKAEYQRVSHLSTQLYFSSMLYNSISGTAIIALGNYYFRSRKATTLTALIASFPIFAALYANFRLSEIVKNYIINTQVRRLGYGQFIPNKCGTFPRNIELSNL